MARAPLDGEDVRLIQALAAERERLLERSRELFAEAEEAKRQARLLTNRKLALKFDCTGNTIAAVIRRRRNVEAEA